MSRLWGAVTAGVLTGLLGVALVPVCLDLEEGLGLDLLFRLRGARSPPPDVAIVTLDRASAETLSLPSDPDEWPRTLHADLIRALAARGVRVIAFDILFQDERSPEEDGRLAEAIREAKNVVLCEHLKREPPGVGRRRDSPTPIAVVERIVPPAPEIARSALALAPFPLPKVPVQVRQYWAFKTGAGDRPTLPVVAFQIFALEHYGDFHELLLGVGAPQKLHLPRDVESVIAAGSVEELVDELRRFFRKSPDTARQLLEALESPGADDHRAAARRTLRSLVQMYAGPSSPHLNFYGPPGTIATVPFCDALRSGGEIETAGRRIELRGKAVFVGLSERLRPEQKDGFYSVFSEPSGLDISGVEIAATAFSNILEDRPVKPIGAGVQLAILLFWGAVLGSVGYAFQVLPATLILTVLGTMYLAFTNHQFSVHGYWYPLINPLGLQAPLSFLTIILIKYRKTNEERKRIRKAFGHYLPDSVVDEVSRNIGSMEKSAKTVYGACLSTDAAQYTRLSERMEPAELRRLMNRYYEAIFEPVRRHGGIVSDVVGDSMMAVWATTEPDLTLRARTCRAALEILRAVQNFNDATDDVCLATRIGLHSGRMALGTVGAIDHYEYRPVGDIVNTVSRIEGLNKHLGTKVLMSGDMADGLTDFLSREIGRFVFVGKTRPIAVHELICRRDQCEETQVRLVEAFERALTLYRRRAWSEAARAFGECLRLREDDGPSRFYLQQCRSCEENPPDEKWAGVIRMKEK